MKDANFEVISIYSPVHPYQVAIGLPVWRLILFKVTKNFKHITKNLVSDNIGGLKTFSPISNFTEFFSPKFYLQDGYKIHQVRRRSDGMVFTIGDVVRYSFAKNSKYAKEYIITNLEASYSRAGGIDSCRDLNVQGIDYKNSISNACMLSFLDLKVIKSITKS